MPWGNLMIGAVIFGAIYGFLLQKADFCFVSAFRDSYAFGHTRVLSGILLALAISLPGWGLVLTFRPEASNWLWIPPVGFTSAIGGFVFGIGMYLAGACASGTLYRAGMGYLHFLLVLAGMKIGYLLFSLLYEPVLVPHYFQPLVLTGPLTLHELVSWPPWLSGLVPVLAGVGFWTLWRGPAAAAGVFKELVSIRAHSIGQILRARHWDARIVGLALGVATTLQFASGSIWGITGPGTRLAALMTVPLVGFDWIEQNEYLAGLFEGYPRS